MINPHCTHKFSLTLNESPSEKEGKFPGADTESVAQAPLNESPSEKEGKCPVRVLQA